MSAEPRGTRPSPATCLADPPTAPLSARAVTVGGKRLVVVANRFLELTFEPGRGGRCVRLRFLDNDEHVVPQRNCVLIPGVCERGQCGLAVAA